MDIGSRNGFPAENLSNFTPHAFIFDGVKCASMEGFLQSLKFSDPERQIEVCGFWGGNAKKKGSKKNKVWKKSQTLFWKGKEIDRHSEEYQLLLDKAFDSLGENKLFQHALLSTGEQILTHEIGKTIPQDTVLTIDEFCQRLEKLRSQLRKKHSFNLKDWVTELKEPSIARTIQLVSFDPETNSFSDKENNIFLEKELRLATKEEIKNANKHKNSLFHLFNRSF